MATITFLGTNTYPLARESTSILVNIDNENKLVLDCCGGITRQIGKIGVSPLEINHVFLSHIHGDHTLGFAWLLMGNFVKRTIMREKGPNYLKVYATKDVFDGAFQIAMIAFPGPMKALQDMIKIEWIDVGAQGPFKITDACSLFAFPVSHSVPTYGCKVMFEDSQKTLVYSADTQPDQNLIDNSQKTDLLIHDTYVDHSKVELARRLQHSTAREAAEVATKANAKKLALVHHEVFYEGQEDLLLTEAKSAFSGEVILPNDLDSIEL